MKLEKEVWLVVVAVAFLLSWFIDKIAGPVVIVIGNPSAFLSSPILLHTYPFTATAIIIRTFAIFMSVMLLSTFIDRMYFAKSAILTFICILAEFFAIQQLTTGFRVTTIQWTLSIAYASIILLIGIIWLLIMGIWSMFNKEKITSSEESILTPPQE